MASISNIYWDHTGGDLMYERLYASNGRPYATHKNIWKIDSPEALASYAELNFTIYDYDIERDSSSGGRSIQIYDSDGTLLWYTKEGFWLDREHFVNMMTQGDTDVIVNPDSYIYGPDPYSYYEEGAYKQVTRTVRVSFYGENEDTGDLRWRDFYVTTPWYWKMPKCNSIDANIKASAPTIYKNDSISASTIKDMLSVSADMRFGNNGFYDWEMNKNYYSLDSVPDTSSGGYKTLSIYTKFRSDTTLWATTNLIVNDIIRTFGPDLKKTSDSISAGSTYDWTQVIPEQQEDYGATIWYGTESSFHHSEVISIPKSWWSSTSNWGTTGVKQITLTIPAANIKTHEAVVINYNFVLSPNKDKVADVFRWQSLREGTGTTKEVVRIHQGNTTSSYAIRWARPYILNVQNIDYFTYTHFTKFETGYQCSTLPTGSSLVTGQHLIHQGDRVEVTLENDYNYNHDYNPISDSSIHSSPSLNAKGIVYIDIRNNNPYSVTCYETNNKFSERTISANSTQSIGSLVGGTSYSIRFKTARSWTQTYRSFSGPNWSKIWANPDIVDDPSAILSDPSNPAWYTITVNSSMTENHYSRGDTIYSGTLNVTTNPKQKATQPIAFYIRYNTSTQSRLIWWYEDGGDPDAGTYWSIDGRFHIWWSDPEAGSGSRDFDCVQGNSYELSVNRRRYGTYYVGGYTVAGYLDFSDTDFYVDSDPLYVQIPSQTGS